MELYDFVILPLFVNVQESLMLARMKYPLSTYIMLFTSLLLISCGSSQQSGLTPLPNDVHDPKDIKLFEAISKYVSKQNAPPNSVYDHVRVDLNGDGRRDALVLFKLPHTYWCGWDGCGMVVFKAHDDRFTPLSAISGIRGPVFVNNTGQHGWRDIIIRISGTKMRDKNIALQFNGNNYPSSPMLAPTLHQPLSSLRVEEFFR